MMAAPPAAPCKVIAGSVIDAIDGLLLTRPDLLRLNGNASTRVVARAQLDPSLVALVSGGGAGHEPAHTGFVGAGMLAAAVVGDVFSSPHVNAILAAMRHVGGPAGVLAIVKNYTGDRLAFGLAAERLRGEGVPVEIVHVADDAAVDGGAVTGRRGVAGTLFVHKLAGATAQSGASLPAVAAVARATANAVVTMGASLTACRVPGQPEPTRLAGAGMELGLGIHGEPGCLALPSVPSARELAGMLVGRIVDRMVQQRGEGEAAGQRLAGGVGRVDIPVAVMVNNLGGLSGIEMGVLTKEVHAAVSAARWPKAEASGTTPSTSSGAGEGVKGVHATASGAASDAVGSGSASVSTPCFRIVRLYAGAFVTALDMRGVSVSILPLSGAELGAASVHAASMDRTRGPARAGMLPLDCILRGLDAPTPCPWPAAPWGSADRGAEAQGDDGGKADSSTGVTIAPEVRTAPVPIAPAVRHPAASAASSSAAAVTGGVLNGGTPIPWSPASSSLLYSASLAACDALEAAAPSLNALDAVCGDADAGDTAATMARAVRAALQKQRQARQEAIVGGGGGSAISSLPVPLASTAGGDHTAAERVLDARLVVSSHLAAISSAIGDAAGGSSGVLYALMAQAGANRAAAYTSPPVIGGATADAVGVWTAALEGALAAAVAAGNASPGDRTLLDALIPAAAVLFKVAAAPPSAWTASSLLSAMAEAAEAGAASTANMRPRAGRSSYLNFDVVAGTVDPGAAAVATWLAAVAANVGLATAAAST